MTDTINNNNINILVDLCQQWPGSAHETIARALLDQQARIAELEAQLAAIGAGGVTGLRNSDTALIDFLANKNQSIANVMLPAHIIERNVHSMRDAIKDAKAEWEAIAQEGGK